MEERNENEITFQIENDFSVPKCGVLFPVDRESLENKIQWKIQEMLAVVVTFMPVKINGNIVLMCLILIAEEQSPNHLQLGILYVDTLNQHDVRDTAETICNLFQSAVHQNNIIVTSQVFNCDQMISGCESICHAYMVAKTVLHTFKKLNIKTDNMPQQMKDIVSELSKQRLQIDNSKIRLLIKRVVENYCVSK